ncbi:MAG: TPM domain-containing protein [Bacteroidetes bacterium]|nr:TPM domain-containing protein [Bacteroidota bacterium]
MAVTPFTPIEEELIVSAIRYAEHKTSGEIRIHIEASCSSDAYKRSVEVFNELKMHETEARNGVLIYVAFKDQKFSILGDTGIHEKLGDLYWEDLKKQMAEKFSKGLLCNGIVLGIMEIGNQLSFHFPYRKDDANELSDEISFA